MSSKLIFFLLTLLISTSSFGRVWQIDMKSSHVEIEVDSKFSQALGESETPTLHGHFCIRRSKPWKCQILSPEDLSKYNIRFFYPDITQEVTGQVTIEVREDRHDFSFTVPSIKKTDRPLLIAQIENKGSKTTIYLRALAKIQELRQKLLSKKTLWPSQGSSEISKYINFLSGLEERIRLKLQGEDTLIAKREYPLQVDNNISRSSSWTNAAEEWQVQVNYALGTNFEGEKSWIDVALTPYFINDDPWKIEYILDGVSLKSYEVTNPSSLISDRFLSPAFSTGEHDFKITAHKKTNNQWVKTFEKNYTIGTLVDPIIPEFTNIQPAPGRYVSKDLHSLSYVAKDSIGRINLESIKAIFDLQQGGELDLSKNLTYVTNGEVLIPGDHGGQEGSSSYKVSGTFKDLPEGIHHLALRPTDFAGNAAQGAEWELVYDRTPPMILLPFTETHPTNEVSFELPVTIADLTKTTIKVFVNGVAQVDVFTDTINFNDAFAIDLQEGINFVRVQATDEAGNTTTVDYPNIFLDTTPPELLAINLQSGQLIRSQFYNLAGQASEPLRLVMINGEEVDSETGSTIFSYQIEHLIDGEQVLDLVLEDLAGNQIEYGYTYQFLLRLLDPELIAVERLDEEKLKIVGHPGAAYKFLEVSAEDGFFNTAETTAAADGSFTLVLDNFLYAKVTAYDPNRDRSESGIVSYKPDTTFSGTVRDIYDNPLPNVKVTLVSSGQSTQTDTSGRFSIKDPILGDQLVTIDGRTIPVDITKGQFEFSVVAINVSLGNKQKNVLERPIYLSPKMLDGSQTIVSAGSAVTVTSPHAPGVSLQIPANAATFPSGTKSGSINVMEIPAEKTSVELLEEAQPERVYALEPSGLSFNQRVKLTLPNVNEFPEGTELVILSKNSESGIWEVDGSATVVGEQIETKPGQGISHFSEVYAAPLGMKMKAFKDGDKPSMDTMSGAISTSVSLPSFKSMGQDISPSLIYNSQWANPNIVISTIFDLPRYYFEASGSVSKGGPLGKVKASETIQRWVTPEYIDAQFFSGEIASEKVRFTGMPDKSLISYQMDLSELPSGIHPAKSSYEVRFKELTIRSQKIKSKSAFGKTKTKTKTWREEKILEEIYPQDLVTTIYHQNKKNSDLGQGWKLNIGKKILNPEQDRIMIEHESGQVAAYTLKNTIETLHYDAKGIKSFNVSGNEVISINADGMVVSTSNGNSQTKYTLPPYSGEMGVNTSWLFNVTRKCTKSGFRGCRRYAYTYYYRCNKFNAGFEQPRNVKSMLVQGGEVIYLDKGGAIFGGSNPFVPVAGLYTKPDLYADATSAWSEQDYQQHCTSKVGGKCSDTRTNFNSFDIAVYKGGTNTVGWCNNTSLCYGGNCTNTWTDSSGKVPTPGFFDGSNTYAQFNQPFTIIQGAEPDSYLIADYGNNLVRKVSYASGITSTVAGNKQTIDTGDGGLAINAGIYHPRGLAVLDDGSFLVSSENGYIRKVTTDGKISAFIGKPSAKGGILADITSMQDVALNSPSAMVYDSQNDFLYVADTGHHRILRVDLKIEEARVVAGNGTCTIGDTLAGKTGLEVSLCRPEQIALDSQGNLLILDESNKMIRRVNFAAPQDGLIRYQPVAKDNTELLRNAQGEFLLKTRDGKETLFSNIGLELETSDRVGRKTTYRYNSQRKLIEAILPTGQSIQLSYSGERVQSITDAAGRVTQLQYNDNKLTSVSFPDGTEKQYTYTTDGVLIEEENQRGIATKYILNEWKRLFKVVRADGTSITTDDAVSKTIANNNDENNPQELKSFGADQDSLKDLIADAKGNTTTFIKDTNGYVQEIKDQDGRVTKIERDAEGRPTKIIKPDSTFTELAYNQSTGDLIRRFESESNLSETYSYNQFGQLLAYKDPLNNIKSNVYDNQTGLLLKEIDPNGNFVSYTYTGHGLIQTSSNKLNLTTTYQYNTEGNVVEVMAPMGEKTNFVRDAAGNVLSKTNAKSQTTTYSFDSFNRLTSVKTPGDHTTSYTYLPTGELSFITNPEGHQTAFHYDDLGRLVKKVSPRGQVTQMSYDDNDNLVQEITPKGEIKTLVYDNKNQLIKKTLPDDEYIYSYSEKGNLIGASNKNSTVTMDYISILGQDHLSSITTQALDLPAHTVSYGYNAAGIRQSMHSNYLSLTYSLDAAYRLIGVTNNLGQSFHYSFDDANRLVGVQRSNGIDSSLSYDGNSFLKDVIHQRGNSLIESFVYTRDQIGNRTSMATTRGQFNFGYDQENQLVSATHPEADSLHALETFSYDSLGNRTADNQGQYAYDDKKYRLEEDYKYLYIYDLNGNITSKQEKGLSGKVWNFAYSSENQLIAAELYEGTTKLKSISYYFDVFGKRLKKVVEDHQTLTAFERKYAYEGHEIIAELDENNYVLVTHTHSGLRTDDVLSSSISPAGVNRGLASVSGNYTYIKDGLGSIQEITNENGSTVLRYIYSSFGKLLKTVDASGVESEPLVKTSYTFTNRELDDETGLYYYRARFYDAYSGRFMQEDNDPGTGFIPVTIINRYSYTGNNPLNRTDPSGNSFLGKLAAVAIGSMVAGPIGALIAINISGDFSSGEKKLANTVAIIATAAIVGVLTGGAVVAAGGAVWMGAVAGAVAGGLVGGLGFEGFGIGSFRDGFHVGFIAGGIGGFFGAGGALPSKGAILNSTIDKLSWQSLTSKAALLGYATSLAKEVANMSCGKDQIYSFSAGGKCIDEPALFWERFL